MGKLRDIFFEQKEDDNKQVDYYRILNNSLPIYSQFGRNIYASDVVQQAVYAIVKEMKKLTPRHDRKNGRDIEPINDDIQFILENPNDFMTFSEFQERYYWSLLLNYNVFVFKEYKLVNGVYKLNALYPLLPQRVDFIEDETGKMFVKFYFQNGESFILPRSRIIHQKIHASFNELMGGNEHGQPDNSALIKTLEINNTLLEGVRKAMGASMTVNGVVKYNTMVKPEIIEENIKKMEEQLNRNQSGFLGLDLKGEFIPIKRDIQLIDDKTLEFIDDKILRHFGVPVAIIRGDFTKETMESFYQSTIEHLVKSQSQEFTKELFTRNQKLLGDHINFYNDELMFMTTEQKIRYIEVVAPLGAIYLNEIRTMFGKAPDPDLVGVRLQSLNWIDVNIAKDYQLENYKKGATENEQKK